MLTSSAPLTFLISGSSLLFSPSRLTYFRPLQTISETFSLVFAGGNRNPDVVWAEIIKLTFHSIHPASQYRRPLMNVISILTFNFHHSTSCSSSSPPAGDYIVRKADYPWAENATNSFWLTENCRLVSSHTFTKKKRRKTFNELSWRVFNEIISNWVERRQCSMIKKPETTVNRWREQRSAESRYIFRCILAPTTEYKLSFGGDGANWTKSKKFFLAKSFEASSEGEKVVILKSN